ncbi:MAG TPA: glutamine--fructose-6-phosphate transaminase (isomerizing), partial [Candidatus Acidoferrum sp.]|nr:glutamine--fructose-6-phosphate transaminase (isomerizing) [Candidatus Acidoferrum sp.]
MCGIVGYIGAQGAAQVLIPSLKRLEYRGYDSAGVAIVDGSHLVIQKSQGKIARLEEHLNRTPMTGTLGIAHTRWATHGVPSDRNAHPHPDCTGRLAVVHNGIIENHRALRERLIASGHRVLSETDTEVLAHLIEEKVNGNLEHAVGAALAEVKGACAVAVVDREFPDRLIAARVGGSPLIIGVGAGEYFLASDIPAVLPLTRDILILEDGEMAILTRAGIRIQRLTGEPVPHTTQQVGWSAEAAEKSGYSHFMLKEIWEQPEAVAATCQGRVDPATGLVCLPELGLSTDELRRLRRIVLVACGTSWHAALVGKYLLEEWAGLPCEVDVASEFRYRHLLVNDRSLIIPISQSGETADTLAALREGRRRKARVISICNVVGSSVARESDGVLYTRAGIEIGVASTKAFTSQLAALYLLGVHLGLALDRLSPSHARDLTAHLQNVPTALRTILRRSDSIRVLATQFSGARDFLYLGRGIHFPVAMEGALKLKEISYIHAEGYPAGEMKHGPIALIDSAMPVVVLAPLGRTYEKVASNIEEVKARHGQVIALVSEGDRDLEGKADHLLPLPYLSEYVAPILETVPLQLLAY